MNFWKLSAPKSELRVERTEEVKLEGVACPVNPGHRRAGRRLTNLSVYLPIDYEYDFLWTWQSECLITPRVLDIFVKNDLTGFEVKPVTTAFKQSLVLPPELLELRPIGWGGCAPRESGIKLEESCAACGLRTYTSFTHPERLVDLDRWDGSDFFFIWPLPRFILLSEWAREVILKHKLTGARLVPLNELRSVSADISPGSLSSYLPADKARSHEFEVEDF